MKKLLSVDLVSFGNSQNNPRFDFPGLKAQYYDEPGDDCSCNRFEHIQTI